MFDRLARALVIALALMPLHACAARPYAMYDRPPPPRDESVAPRPGFIWIHGRWERDGGRWIWHEGQYEAERPGYEYVEGRWEKRGDYYVWIDGGWRPTGDHQ